MNRGDIDVHTDVGDKVLMRSSLPGHATTFAEVRKVLPEWLPENASPPRTGLLHRALRKKPVHAQ